MLLAKVERDLVQRDRSDILQQSRRFDAEHRRKLADHLAVRASEHRPSTPATQTPQIQAWRYRGAPETGSEWHRVKQWRRRLCFRIACVSIIARTLTLARLAPIFPKDLRFGIGESVGRLSHRPGCFAGHAKERTNRERREVDKALTSTRSLTAYFEHCRI